MTNTNRYGVMADFSQEFAISGVEFFQNVLQICKGGFGPFAVFVNRAQILHD